MAWKQTQDFVSPAQPQMLYAFLLPGAPLRSHSHLLPKPQGGSKSGLSFPDLQTTCPFLKLLHPTLPCPLNLTKDVALVSCSWPEQSPLALGSQICTSGWPECLHCPPRPEVGTPASQAIFLCPGIYCCPSSQTGLCGQE